MPPPSRDEIRALVTRCRDAFMEAYVAMEPGLGGWSKYYVSSKSEVGIWGTVSGLIALSIVESLGLPPHRLGLNAEAMRRGGAAFLARQQLSQGPDCGAWSITQLTAPPFVDTTAAAIRALIRTDPEAYEGSIRSGVAWLVSQQLAKGGWSNLERDHAAREVGKTCSTCYALLAISGALDCLGWSARERQELEGRLQLGIGALAAGLTTTLTGPRATGWGRSLDDRNPDAAYTSIAVVALRELGQPALLEAYGPPIARLFATSRNGNPGSHMDQGPWPVVREIWTPPLPLTERFLIFFGTAWAVRALVCLGDAAGTELVDEGMGWLTRCDSEGRYSDYYNQAHNFAATDALLAASSYLELWDKRHPL